MPTVGTVRPYQKTNRPSPATGDKFISDNATNGVGATDWTDLCNALQAALGNNMTVESVADAATRNGLAVTTGQVGKRLVRQNDTGVFYLANAAGSGASVWTQWVTIPTGTSSVLGVLMLASAAEAIAGTDAAKAITASTLKWTMDQFHSSKKGRDHLYSDGTTPNRCIQQVLPGNVAGSDTTLLGAIIYVPTANLTTNAVIWDLVSNTAPGSSPAANSLYCVLRTIGSLQIAAFGAAGATDTRALDYATFRADYSGRFVHITVALSGNSTTSPTIFADGVNITSKFTLTTGGTVPNWMDANLSATYLLQGYNWPEGYFVPCKPINRKFAQADIDFVKVTGVLTGTDEMGGIVAAGYTSDFSAGADGWTANGTANTVTGNIDAIGGQNDTLQVNNATGGALACSIQKTSPISSPIGKRFKFTAKAYIDVGAFTATAYLGFGSSASPATESSTGVALVEGAWVDCVFYAVFQRGDNNIVLNVATAAVGGAVMSLQPGKSLYLKNVTMTQVGALSDPIIQPCRVLDDATPNNRAALLLGFSAVTTKKEWRVPVFVDMTTTGNKQLLAGALFDTPTSQVIDTIEDSIAGTPTYSVGDGTTATKYTASTARTAGRARLSLASNFPADSAKTGIYANITVASASDSAALIVVRGHKQ